MTDALQLQAKKLNFFQRMEMQKAYDQNLSGEFIAVIAWGHSDIGTGGIRSARQMRAIRKLLCSHRLRFSAISIFALSDEIVQLYAYGFDHNIRLKDIAHVIAGYQEAVQSIRNWGHRLKLETQQQQIMHAYHTARRALFYFEQPVNEQSYQYIT